VLLADRSLCARGDARVIAVDNATAEFVTRVLNECGHPEALTAVKKMVRAAVETQARELEFNNEVPALCRPQA
jgi:Arc/MetJ family transcription regulator